MNNHFLDRGLFLLLCLHTPGSFFAQSKVVWSDSIAVVSTNLAITAPKISFLPDGSPIVSWGASSSNTNQIWCSTFLNGGFTPPVSVVQSPNLPILFGFGGYDMSVYNNQVFIVFEEQQGGIWCTKSIDGGQSFQAAVQVQPAVSGGFATISAIETDDNGNPMISYIKGKDGADYEVRRSSDGGESFGDPVVANTPAPGGEVCECCSSDLLVSGDSVWIVFRNNNQNLRDIWISRSTNLAASFDVAADVDETDWVINVCPISGPKMTRMHDSIASVWMSRPTGIFKVFANTLHASNMIPGQQIALYAESGPLVNQTFPEITARGDTVGIVFQEKAKEIVFLHSMNGLSQIQTSAQRFAVPNHTLQWPTIAFRNGIFHLVYADAAADKIFYRRGTLLLTNPAVEANHKESVIIFPNPVYKGIIHLQSPGSQIEEVTIWNTLGQMVHQWTGLENDVELQVSMLTPGIYTTRIRNETGISFQNLQIF
jgi:hypothetical protein